MANQYFIRRGEKVNGPLGVEKLRALIAEKKLKPGDDISQSRKGPWDRLGKVYKSILDEDSVDEYGESDVDEYGESELDEYGESELDEYEDELPQPRKRSKAKKNTSSTKNRKGQSQKKKKKRKGGFAKFYTHYAILFKLAGVATVVLVVGVFVVSVVRQTEYYRLHERDQNQMLFMGKTTGDWLDLQREGEAHHSEVLWKDNRWMPLSSVIGLDMAALPDLLAAVADERTKEMAEDAMGKPPKTKPGGNEPRLEHLVAGLKHENPLVRTWAAKMAVYYAGKKEDVLPLLEEIVSSSDTEASAAATEAIRGLKGP